MQPSTIDRLTRLAEQHSATLRVVPLGQGDPDIAAEGIDPGARFINGVYAPVAYFHHTKREITLEYDPETMSPDAAEITALHEIGHAATLRRPVRLDGFDQMLWALGHTPQPIQEIEIQAWEWAAPQLRPELHDQARAQITWALGSYGVAPDVTAERVLALL